MVVCVSIIVHVPVDFVWHFSFLVQQMRRIDDHIQAVRFEVHRTVDELAGRWVHTEVDGIDDRYMLLVIERFASYLVHHIRKQLIL